MKTSHFLLVPLPAWGHVRPLCVLATRLVREQDNVIVTFMIVPYLLDKVRAEISAQCREESSEALLERIRILSPCPPQETRQFTQLVQTFADAYSAVYQTLCQAKPITCSVTGATFDAVPVPSVVILDLYLFPLLRATRAVSGHSVPIIGFLVIGLATMIRIFGPESIGGAGDYGAKIEAEVARTGLPDSVIGPKIFYHTEGQVIRVPGVPAMYDHEFFPQELVTINESPQEMIKGAYKFFRESDGVIETTSCIYEPASLDAMKQWLSGMQKELYVFGPILPTGYGIENRKGKDEASADTEAFLEKMLAQHGKRSVFFISFGTLFWPADAQYFEELIEALIEKKTPFIFAHAHPSAKISEQLRNDVESSGLGMLTAWSPQQFVLNHPATGWFVSHAGFNGVIESLASGIPLICWPLAADQPAIAAQITDNSNVAFELFEIRTGEKGLLPIHRIGRAPKGTREAAAVEIRQTIDLCRGEKGQELRRNAEQIKVKFADTWKEDGNARKGLLEFLHKYI